jgi:Acetyltransferase (GNAT) domain
MISIHRIDPLQDRRWDDFLLHHSQSSIFHTRAWLQAIRATYGYEPLAFVKVSTSGSLTDAIVFCRIKSFITGSRLVSVPFADHCDPLVRGSSDLDSLLLHVQRNLASEECQHFELRPLSTPPMDLQQRATLGRSYAHHLLNLQPNLETLFHHFHKSCIQRKIRRAEREGLVYDEGVSNELVREFYRLFVLTRRRHGLPPQPLAWFFNLRDALGDALKVRMISKAGKSIASIVTAQYKQRLVYKYGASDAQFHKLGPMPLLFWRTIQEAKQLALCEFDLGRSDLTGRGLIAFKDHLGASCSVLGYYRYPASPDIVARLGRTGLVPRLCTYLPTSLMRVAGSILYRHIG